MNKKRTGMFTALALLLAGLCSTALAADGSWTVNVGGSWTNAANWAGGTIANGAGSTAYFTNNITAQRDVMLTAAAPVTNGAIVIGDSNGSSIFRIRGTATNNVGLIVFDNGSNGATLTQLATSGGDTIGMASVNPTLTIRLDSNLAITNFSANMLTVGAHISGANKAITVAGGSGGVTMEANNTYSGGLTLKSGLLNSGTSEGSFGAGALTLSGGELRILSSSPRTMSVTGTTVDGDATITSSKNALGAGVLYNLKTLSIGANKLTVKAGSVVNSGTAAVAFDATTITGAAIFDVTNNVAGVTSSLTLGALTVTGGSLTKTGNGGLLLKEAATTFDGKITVSMGTLTTTANATNAFGTGGLTVADGATLILGNASSLDDLSALVLGSSSGLQLNFAGVDTVGSISLDGGISTLGAGTWTSADLRNLGLTGATGVGSLTVIPEPATIGMLGLGALVTLLLRRMRTR